MNLQIKTKIEKRHFYYFQTKLSSRSLLSPPRQRQITHSPAAKGVSLFLDFFDLCISLRPLVIVDSKSFHELL